LARIVDSWGEKDSNGAWKSVDLPLSLADIQKIIRRADIMLEAISLNHVRGPDGKCLPGCWSCKVEDSLQAILVAKELGEHE